MYKNVFKLFDTYAVIYAKKGEEIIVDIEKVEDLAKNYKWHINRQGEPTANYKKDGIAYRIKMKHILLNAFQSGKVIYYLNGNALDNRIENVSFCKNQIILKEDYAIIKSSDDTKNKVSCKIDIDMIDKVKQYSWTTHQVGYLFFMENKKRIFLHNFVLDIDTHESNLNADHIDRDPTNNRRENLRVSTHIQNQYNKGKKIKSNTTSQYKGVSKKPKSKGWNVSISADGKYYYLGTYSTELTAAIAYNIACKKLHKEFAVLNDVPEMELKELNKFLIQKVKHTNYRGISFKKKNNVWIASLKVEGKYIHIGSYKTEIDAARAYNNKIIELGLDKNKLNKIEEVNV